VDGCEILHHHGWLKPYNGINHLSTGAGFLPSTVSPKNYKPPMAQKCLSSATHWRAKPVDAKDDLHPPWKTGAGLGDVQNTRGFRDLLVGSVSKPIVPL